MHPLSLALKLTFAPLISIRSSTFSGFSNIFFKNDSETTMLVCGMHGLFKPVFPLTTNKYPRQSASVYLACLSALSHVVVTIQTYCMTTSVFSPVDLGELIHLLLLNTHFSLFCGLIDIFKKLFHANTSEQLFNDFSFTS